MTVKEAAANSLLAFVAATCVVLIVRVIDRPQSADTAPPGSAGSSPGQQAAAASPKPAIPDGIRVYYLHGNVRCPTCRTIEAYAKEAVETGFAAEIQNGKVTWEVVNYDQPGNRQYQTQYAVVAPTVVVTKWRDGKQVDWRNLNEVWEYANDKSAFQAFVQRHVREFLGRPTLASAPGIRSRPSGSGAGDRVLPVPEPLGMELAPPATAGSNGSAPPQPPMPGDLPIPPTSP